MRDRRFYATLGRGLRVHFTVDGALMGRRSAVHPARGLSWRVVGQTFGLHPDTCRRIWRERRDESPIDTWDMRQDVEELVDAYDARDRGLAIVAARMEPGGSRVRAIKARLALQREKFALLYEVAGAPRLSVLPQERDLQVVAQTVIEVLERNRVPDEVQRQIADALDKVNSQRRPTRES